MILAGRGLVCDYGPLRALDGVDVDAAAGEILAVFGPNGAGKSTLLRVLCGERRPDGGTVALDDRPVSGADPGWRSRVGLVSHRTGLYERLTVAENLAFFAAMQLAPPSADAVARALEQVGAGAWSGVPARALSRGQRQRVALARSLLHDPDILFLDEPFTGLDPSSATLLERVLAARRRADCIVVLVTHDLVRGLDLCDRVVVLRRGRKVLEGEAAAWSARALLPFFSAGGSARE